MIEGDFGELYFEIDLIAADGSVIGVSALLDTGFTDWLAMNSQDAESLHWLQEGERAMLTARGEQQFELYRGTVSFDHENYLIPVLASETISEFLIGLVWLEDRRLIVDRQAGSLILE